MLALLPRLSMGSTTTSVVTVLLLLKVVLYLAGELVVSPSEDLSLDLTLPEFEFLENMSMVWSATSLCAPSHLNIHHKSLCLAKARGHVTTWI